MGEAMWEISILLCQQIFEMYISGTCRDDAVMQKIQATFHLPIMMHS
jgi:hypothetical protein